MKKFLFIGIDFSKSKFDVTILKSIDQQDYVQATFENESKSFNSFLKWVSKQSDIAKQDWLFCGEHTGLYSRSLAEFLVKKNLFIWLENPLQVKCSWGIKRAKTDRIDSLEIARYALRFQDKANACKPANKEIESLRLLLAYRGRLVKNKVSLEVAAKETRRVINRDTTSRFIFESSQRDVERIKKEIEVIETKMHETIMSSHLKQNYLLVNSIKGVGMITSITLIIHTDNFAAFETARQLACYCGVVPFEKSSGTSINGGNHISQLANKDIKVLLTQCARCAVQHDKELAVYYARKIAQGKKERLVINNVRNKLIHRIFAVVTNKIPYRENYLNPWADCA
jgi:transposase